MSKRAQRRHDYRRLKKKRSTYWGDYGDDRRPYSARNAGLKVSAPKPKSSCMCCMNQRIIDGPTRQERKADKPTLSPTES